MAKFCTKCGKEIADGMAFCTECGTPAPADAQKPSEEAIAVTAAAVVSSAPQGIQPQAEPQQTFQQPVQQAYQPPVQQAYQPPVQQQPIQQAYQPPVQQMYQQQPAPQEPRPTGGKYGVVSTGAFFGMMLLFAIPVVGWITCIIMAFAPKNENIKHYARAMLIWLIIAAVLCVILFLLFSWLGGAINNYISELTDGKFSDFGDIFGQFGSSDFNCLSDLSGITAQ